MILIVDDTVPLRNVLVRILTLEGYDGLVVADSAQHAFDQIGLGGDGSQPVVIPDLILMDIRMPGMDGIAACRLIKETPVYADVPIVMITAEESVANLHAAFHAGAMDFIRKPYNQVELLARVRSALILRGEINRRVALEQELAALRLRLEG